MPASPPAKERHEYRHFFLKVGIPFIVVSFLVLGGFKNIFIIAGEARTTATVTEVRLTGSGRCSILYRYEVNGQTYQGRGAPDHEPYTPPYSAGTTYEIRYAKAHPAFSTPQNPYTLFGQLLFACLILVWIDYTVTASERRKAGEVESNPFKKGPNEDS